MIKILFLHGFFASGQCVPAMALQEAFGDEAMRDAMRGCDAVVWTVGVSMDRHYEGMPSLDGHKLLIKAMKELGIKRLIDYGTPSVKFERDKRSFITEFMIEQVESKEYIKSMPIIGS